MYINWFGTICCPLMRVRTLEKPTIGPGGPWGPGAPGVPMICKCKMNAKMSKL